MGSGLGVAVTRADANGVAVGGGDIDSGALLETEQAVNRAEIAAIAAVLLTRLFGSARGGALQEQGALASVLRERRRTLELGARLG